MKTQIIPPVFFVICGLLLTQNSSAMGFKKPTLVQGTRFLYRGPQPTGHAAEIAQMGISEVVIFKNDVKGEVETESGELIEAGFNKTQIYKIPMEWKKLNIKKSCRQTMAALQVLIDAERSGRALLFHCTAGEDRTGMLAGLAQMLLVKTTTNQTFTYELCDRGYSDGDRKKPLSVVGEIEKGLSPLFFTLAQKIEKGEISIDRLDPEICDDLRVDQVQAYACPR